MLQGNLPTLVPNRNRVRGERSRWLRREVEDDGGRSLVEQRLDELHERVRILKACTRIEAGDHEESPVALHAPIYPPRPDVLTLSPASDLHSGHAKSLSSVRERDSWHPFGRWIIIFVPERLSNAGWAVLSTYHEELCSAIRPPR